ncbi:hypothetical protein ACLOJK_016732 [Asimina triloba]
MVKVDPELNLPNTNCIPIASAGECADTLQRPDLVASIVIEANTNEGEDEDGNHDLDYRELTLLGECVSTQPRHDLVVGRVVEADTDDEKDEDRSLCRQKKLDIVAGKMIKAETLTTRKTKTIATILVAGNLHRQRKPDLVTNRVIDAETPAMRKICGNDELSELQGSRARMLWVGENGENDECDCWSKIKMKCRCCLPETIALKPKCILDHSGRPKLMICNEMLTDQESLEISRLECGDGNSSSEQLVYAVISPTERFLLLTVRGWGPYPAHFSDVIGANASGIRQSGA